MAGSDDDRSARTRAAFREFVRTHHPDVGGDPDEFAAGVAEFRAQLREQSTPDRSGPDRERYDAPVEIVHRALGVRGLARRVRAWRARRRRRADLR